MSFIKQNMKKGKRSITGDDIPQELQHEILSWLPGMSLARFRCVCKLWDHSMIPNAFLLRHSRPPVAVPDNVYHYTFHNNTDCLLVLLGANLLKKGVFVSLPPINVVGSSESLSSNFCDDLICLYRKWQHGDCSSILLYSARLEDFIILPRKRNDPFNATTYVGAVSEQWCSLGFDPIQSKYKVVRLIRRYRPCQKFERTLSQYYSRYEILTVGSDSSWRTLDHVPGSLHRHLPHGPSFCLDGIIHWLYIVFRGNIMYIVSFDLMCEEFRMVNVNRLVGWNYCEENRYYLTPLKGCATLFFRNKENKEIEQWTLSKAVWTRSSIIGTSHVLSSIWVNTLFRGSRSSIGVHKRWQQSGSCTFSCYDFENNTMWDVDTENEVQQ